MIKKGGTLWFVPLDINEKKKNLIYHCQTAARSTERSISAASVKQTTRTMMVFDDVLCLVCVAMIRT
ncbi:MAG: hypothetical protein RR653_10795, partial [Clostridia bacterium]